jgi:hypothetical protein
MCGILRRSGSSAAIAIIARRRPMAACAVAFASRGLLCAPVPDSEGAVSHQGVRLRVMFLALRSVALRSVPIRSLR